MPAAAYLDRLNPEQRCAVEHGVGARGEPGAPLLVIAGASSEKTDTLAHRAAAAGQRRGAHAGDVALNPAISWLCRGAASIILESAPHS